MSFLFQLAFVSIIGVIVLFVHLLRGDDTTAHVTIHCNHEQALCKKLTEEEFDNLTVEEIETNVYDLEIDPSTINSGD